MYVFLVEEDCCDGQLKRGDVVVHSERGYECFRYLPLHLGAAVGLAALDGKLQCIYPSDVISLEAHAVLKLAAAVAPYLPVAPAVEPAARTGSGTHPYLRKLK